MCNKGLMMNVGLAEIKKMTPEENLVFVEQMNFIAKEMEKQALQQRNFPSNHQGTKDFPHQRQSIHQHWIHGRLYRNCKRKDGLHR